MEPSYTNLTLEKSLLSRHACLRQPVYKLANQPDGRQTGSPNNCKIAVLSLLLILSFSSLIRAHHELLPAPEREYLKLISQHPFKDTLITQGNYNYFITVAESAPDTYELIFYIENSLFRRAEHSPKEVLIYRNESETPERFILESDRTGASMLTYFSHEPFQAKIKVMSTTSDNQPLSIETNIQIGSPKPSFAFIAVFGLLIMIAIVIVHKLR